MSGSTWCSCTRPGTWPEPTRRGGLSSARLLPLTKPVGEADTARSVFPPYVAGMTSSLVRTEVRHDGLVGVLFHPEPASDSTATLPGILVLGGSEGGLHEIDAAFLAERGYAALALAYYGLPGLPDVLKNIPLEYFATALDYLRA